MRHDGLPNDVAQRLDAMGAADLVVGLPACADADAAREMAGRAVAGALPGQQAAPTAIVVVRTPAATGGRDSEPDPGIAGLQVLPFPFPPVDGAPGMATGHAEAGHAVLAIARRIRARAIAVWMTASPDPGPAPGLLQPVLRDGMDLVLPCYARGRFEGLITAAILYPLTRAVYGKRVRCPLVEDFAASARLAERFLDSRAGSDPAAPLEWMLGEALAGGLKVSQAEAGPRPIAPREPADLASVLSRVVGALFEDVERHAASWQTVRGSEPVATFGTTAHPDDDAGAVDVHALVESFHLGYRNLADLWGAVLPPATQLDLRKLARAPIEDFSMPDDVWARVVYDFALGYRLRVMNRDHLLRSMVPIYLAWVASYAANVAALGPGEVAERAERLCLAYERQKPYLLSRWRWPDRFSP